MKYLLLIYQNEQVLNDAERERCYVESAQLAQDLHAGGPDARHWSTAAANASWAASSATSKSPVTRINEATIRPQSER